MINRRLRSEKEVVDYLSKSSISDEDSEKIISTLKSIGLVNDYNFARAYTNDKMHLTLCGPYKIAIDLQSHNIDSVIINEMIDNYPEELISEHIEKIIMKKIKTNKRYVGNVLKRRIVSYLSKLGYSRESISKHLYLITIDTDLMQQEMEKTYKSYAAKYSGDDLYFKVKAKLISRGFESSDINNFLDNVKKAT